MNALGRLSHVRNNPNVTRGNETGRYVVVIAKLPSCRWRRSFALTSRLMLTLALPSLPSHSVKKQSKFADVKRNYGGDSLQMDELHDG